MTLALRRTGPDDFDVIHDGEIVGRIYRMKADRELWRWMTPGLRADPRPERWRGGYIGRGQGRVPADVGWLRRF